MVRPVGKIVAGGMLREGTPIEHYPQYNLWVKREDLSCPKPGPPFSKTRGVYAHIAKRPERIIGVLDTFHSQAGHAVARACQILGKQCINFYPVYKNLFGLQPPQQRSQELGASLVGLPAGRSCILYHAMKKQIAELGGYAMPNALKLQESVEETAKEVERNGLVNGILPDTVLIAASSGTIAAGVIRGYGLEVRYALHMGYRRSEEALREYVCDKAGFMEEETDLSIFDEGYEYKDEARPGETPPWPCNSYYDLKTFRWWMNQRADWDEFGTTLLWNIG